MCCNFYNCYRHLLQKNDCFKSYMKIYKCRFTKLAWSKIAFYTGHMIIFFIYGTISFCWFCNLFNASPVYLAGLAIQRGLRTQSSQKNT